MKRLARPLALILGILLLAGAASAADRWLHVRVSDGIDGEVSINLPASALDVAATWIDGATDWVGNVEVHSDSDVSLDDLRGLWRAVRDRRGSHAELERGRDTVRLENLGQRLRLSVEGSDPVELTLPHRFVDALLPDHGDELDVAGALRLLADETSGELLEIRSGRDRISVWIDFEAAGR